MAQEKISQLPNASTPTGSEYVAMVQSSVTVKGTLAQILGYILPPIPAGDIMCRATGSGSGTPAACGTLPTAAMPAFTGDCTVATGTTTIACTATGGVTFKASATTDTTIASNITSGTLPAGRLPAFSGDFVIPIGTVVGTLATVNTNVGAYGSATTVASITANAKGLVTGVVSIPISISASQVTSGLAPSATTDTTIASNITSGTLPVGRLPALSGVVTEVAGTGVTAYASSTGSGAAVLATSPTLVTPTLTSPTLVTPALGTPSSGNLANTTNLPASALPALTGVVLQAAGTGVTTFNASTGAGNVVLSTSPTLVTPALGTPTSLNLANATNLPAAALPALTGVVTTTAGTVSTAFSGGSTGSGAVVLATGPVIDLTNATGAPAISGANISGVPAAAITGALQAGQIVGTTVTPQSTNATYPISQADNGNILFNTQGSGACPYTLPQTGSGGTITAGGFQTQIFSINTTTCSLSLAGGVTSTMNNASSTIYLPQYGVTTITADNSSSPGNYVIEVYGGCTFSQAGVASCTNGYKANYFVANGVYGGFSGQGWMDQGGGSHTICLGTDTSHAACVDVQQNLNLNNNLVSVFAPGITQYPAVTLSGAGCAGSGVGDTTGTVLSGVSVSNSATITNTGTNGLYYGETIYSTGGVFTAGTTTPIPNGSILYVTNANGVLSNTTFQVSSTNPGVTAATTNASVTFSATNTYTVNQAVVLTGQVPGTNFTLGNVYYIRNPTGTTFELSATSGGSSIQANLAGGTQYTFVSIPGAAIAPSAAPTTQPAITVASGNYQHSGGPHSGAFIMPAAATYATGSCTVTLTFNVSKLSGGGFAPTGHNCNMQDETAPSQMTQNSHGNYSCAAIKSTLAASQDWIRFTDDPY